MILTESILSTDRLILRPSTPADQDALCDIFGDPEVMKMFDVGYASPRTFTYEETGQWIKNHIGIDIAPWTILLKESGEAIGWGGIAYCADDPQPQAELLYLFGREHWGRGYATEMAAVAIAYGFSFDGITSIESGADPDNAPSIRVMEKVGMLRSGLTEAGRLIYSVAKPTE